MSFQDLCESFDGLNPCNECDSFEACECSYKEQVEKGCAECQNESCECCELSIDGHPKDIG